MLFCAGKQIKMADEKKKKDGRRCSVATVELNLKSVKETCQKLPVV